MQLLKGGGARRDRGTFHALSDVSFQLERGKTFGLIGANGAGKSTALKLMSRIIEPTSGSVRVSGRVGALLELGAGFHPELTGRENVFLSGAVLGLGREEVCRRFERIVAFSELEDFIDLPVKHYSSGMYVRLGFSVAVHTDPEILLVDEVLAVGDASFSNKCLTHISEMRRGGVTIVLVSHAESTVQSLCDQVIWLDKGALVTQGAATDVVMAYLRHVADQDNARAANPVVLSKSDVLGTGGGPMVGVSRWGSGRIRICRVDICNDHGVPMTSFHTGEPFEVRIGYEARQRVESPVFGIAVHHQNGAHVTGPNTRTAGLNIPSVCGRGAVVYRLPHLPLLSGAYTISVAAHDYRELEMFDYHDRSYPFQVYPGRSLEQYGIVALDGQWSIAAGES